MQLCGVEVKLSDVLGAIWKFFVTLPHDSTAYIPPVEKKILTGLVLLKEIGFCIVSNHVYNHTFSNNSINVNNTVLALLSYICNQ